MAVSWLSDPVGDISGVGTELSCEFSAPRDGDADRRAAISDHAVSH
jgi:hypothetical protein